MKKSGTPSFILSQCIPYGAYEGDKTVMKSESIWDFLEFVEKVKLQPELLESDQLPPEFVRAIKPLIQVKKATNQTIEDLATEIQQLYTELNEFKPLFTGGEEDRDAQQQYLKLKAALISKLVDLKERTVNLRTLKSFQDKVLLAVDKVMDAEQRTEFMKVLSE